MRESVEQGGGHLGIAEHVGPFGEAQVGGDDHAGALVEFGEQVEQQGTACLAEGQVAQLIENDKIRIAQAQGDLALPSSGLLLLQCIDQLDGRQEAHASMMLLHGFDANGGGQVRLACARATDQHDVLRTVQERAAMKPAHQRFIDAALGEVEADQIAMRREPRRLHLVGERLHLALRTLGGQQLAEPLLGIERALPRLGRQFGPRRGHPMQLQGPQACDQFNGHDPPPQ